MGWLLENPEPLEFLKMGRHGDLAFSMERCISTTSIMILSSRAEVELTFVNPAITSRLHMTSYGRGRHSEFKVLV